MSLQSNFPLIFGNFKDDSISEAVEELASQGGTETLGAIFTRTEVVNFILDLTGYKSDRPLYNQRLLEPSFGGGDFLLPAIERLIASWQNFGGSEFDIENLKKSIRATEIHKGSFEKTYSKTKNLLIKNKFSQAIAEELTSEWLTQGDFLLQPFDKTFNYIVGNPPYVRQELIPPALLTEYRRRYETIYDRADLYIPFIERSLSLLSENGNLGFICADRWMKNRYGGPLRNLISKNFHLKVYIDMTDTPAFHTDVVAYPAITIIGRENTGKTLVAHRPNLDETTLSELAFNILSEEPSSQKNAIIELYKVVNGANPWLLESSDQMALIRRLESEFPCLEESGCKVGIGVATGADKAFIGNFDSLDVESDRKLPIATTKDISTGQVLWKGLGVINPFKDEGGLVDLEKYPKLKKYLESRREIIAGRHCARKSPSSWYKTIDRITPSLAKKEKLLIPDIKGEAHVVYEDGKLYPHHNLYVITSDTWDLRALQAVLLSSVSKLFVATYSTKMRGGFLRFQAQYLRRIRLPLWDSVPSPLRRELISAAERLDLQACNAATFRMYKMTAEEILSIGG
ncbi:Eco57I restriction-modification methylase domain-containing protein [Pseudomonas sp. PLB05]|uniref:Eco57I restriction-modification methylase domain-containing protein n=1 Tax=Pseudomonas sp. PLB05 TaxID=2899078 RepID=UPI001E4EE74E|nr:Eco57I restriction-modification methylase domain-containing protein [Pseudomonas sp. PLB05]MCD4863424.1 Eco57I restriction-modification methylase domain-containing protein [Pseudomonas sp. PLB05]